MVNFGGERGGAAPPISAPSFRSPSGVCYLSLEFNTVFQNDTRYQLVPAVSRASIIGQWVIEAGWEI